jgi:hypothetical protein
MALDFIKEALTKYLISGDVATVDESHQKAFTSLFARPYFSRLWVMQEIVLAKDLEIICGRDSLLWPNLPLTAVFPDFSAPCWFSDRIG